MPKIKPFYKFLISFFEETCQIYNDTPRKDNEDKSYNEGKKNAICIILQEFKERNIVAVPVEVLENIEKYCEEKAIYDKLGNHGDFYYKIKSLLYENKNANI